MVIQICCCWDDNGFGSGLRFPHRFRATTDCSRRITALIGGRPESVRKLSVVRSSGQVVAEKLCCLSRTQKASSVFEQEAAEVAEEAILQSTCQKGLKFLSHRGLTRTVPSASSVHAFSAALLPLLPPVQKKSQRRIQHTASRTQRL